jgi:hypothetical protein
VPGLHNKDSPLGLAELLILNLRFREGILLGLGDRVLVHIRLVLGLLDGLLNVCGNLGHMWDFPRLGLRCVRIVDFGLVLVVGLVVCYMLDVTLVLAPVLVVVVMVTAWCR